jgi:hypothetical protein
MGSPKESLEKKIVQRKSMTKLEDLTVPYWFVGEKRQEKMQAIVY